MNIYYVIVAGCGAGLGVVGGIFLEKFLRKQKEKQQLRISEILAKKFGNPVYVTRFSFGEAMNWIGSHEAQIQDGAKGFIKKLDKDTFAQVKNGQKINFDIKNYLLLSVCKNEEFLDSLLVKYESLDEKLEEALKEGNGMVIEK